MLCKVEVDCEGEMGRIYDGQVSSRPLQVGRAVEQIGGAHLDGP
jgi:hypothetical protein